MIQYSREIEVRYQADIFIAGGGPSGCAAAWAAALAGKKVILAVSGFGTMNRRNEELKNEAESLGILEK